MGFGKDDETIDYALEARRFHGTPAEVLPELDALIESLLGVRKWLESKATPPPLPVRERIREKLRSTIRWAPAAVLALLLPTVAHAQTAGPAGDEPASAPQDAASSQKPPAEPFAGLRLGLTLETFYEVNANRPFDRVNTLRAYDTRANAFGLQQTAIVIERAVDVAAGRRAGARVDLQFGQATETVQGSAANEPRPEVYRALWQAYGTYVVPVGRGLQVDMGKFASSLGYETNYAKDNQHFSRAFLFNFLPFYHAGLRASLPLGDRVTVSYLLTNGIQQAEEFNDARSQQVMAVVTPLQAVTWTLNYYAGQEQPDGGAPDGPDGVFRVLDTYVSWTVTPALSLGADLNRTTNAVTKAEASRVLQGAGFYARYRTSTCTGLALRYERLDDDGLFAGVGQVLHGLTATAELALAEGFLVRGEVRRDWSTARVFTGPADGDPRRHQATALVGLVWWFGNKPGAW